MASGRSVENILAWLDVQIAHDREKEAFHAQQEALHREQRAVFAAELEKLTAIRDSFKTAADTARDIASRVATLPSPAPNPDIGRRKPSLTRMVERIVEIRPAGQAFGASAIAREINRHFGERLRRPVKVKLVSIVLRRMADAGRLRTVEAGRPHHEGRYARAGG
jgi:hypothetical protein